MSPTKSMFAEEKKTVSRRKDVTKKTQEAKKAPQKPQEAILGSPGYNVLDLPSKGLLGYPASVEYRDIMVGDEETLALATTSTYFRTLNGVLKSILNDCPYYEKLTVYDRDYILMWLWANNYSAVKDVNVECRACSHEASHRVDLTEIEIQDVDSEIPAEFKIPLSKGSLKEVTVRLSTVQDELDAEEYVRSSKEQVSFNGLLRAASIQTGFEMPFAKKVEWVKNNITSREMGNIKKYHQHFKYGVPNAVNHTCPKCKEVTVGQLPFQAEDILFPTVQSDFEELLRSSKSSGSESE